MDIWGPFEAAINGPAFDLFNQKEITWKRLSKKLDLHGEGTNTVYDEVTLKCLLRHNAFRAFPIDKDTAAGSLDEQHVIAIFNKKYLRDNGYLNDSGHFAFNSKMDYFVIDGITYQDVGDTQASQSYGDNVLFYLILKRIDTPTGQASFGYPDHSE